MGTARGLRATRNGTFGGRHTVSISDTDLCFVYCATGAGFRDECAKSIHSLQNAHGSSTLRIEVFTDRPDVFGEWGRPIETPVYGEMDKLFALKNTSFDRFVFLDTDTTVLSPLDDLFRLLNTYDFLATHAPIRFKFPEMEMTFGPSAFPQFNSGVIGMRKNTAFVDTWIAAYEHIKRVFPDIYPGQAFGKDDQTALRKALLDADGLSIFALPGEYNVRPFGGGFSGPPIIVHDRDFQDLAPKIQQRLIDHTRSFGRASENAYPMAYVNGRKNTFLFILRCLASGLKRRRVIDYLALPRQK